MLQAEQFGGEGFKSSVYPIIYTLQEGMKKIPSKRNLYGSAK